MSLELRIRNAGNLDVKEETSRRSESDGDNSTLEQRVRSARKSANPVTNAKDDILLKQRVSCDKKSANNHVASNKDEISLEQRMRSVRKATTQTTSAFKSASGRLSPVDKHNSLEKKERSLLFPCTQIKLCCYFIVN
jgi:hypothetical protein